MSSHAATGQVDHHHDHTTTTGIPNKKLLWWAFLASDCMFFGALISTHLVYRLNPPPGNAEPTKVFNIELTSFSTFILLMSSLLMALAVNAIQRGNVKSTRTMILGTIFFGCIFLGGQVYEFEHFVHAQKMTLSNSIFGSTFYTLTGTHGTHVAIGVLLLGMLYVRTFKPANGGGLAKNFLHLLTLSVVIAVSFIWLVPGLIEIFYGAHFGDWIKKAGIPLAVGAVAAVVLFLLGKSHGAVEFGEKNAIDVEAIGLYWHFVDIVWIIIFTAVYLLEYL
ncbi:cytochrome c oxidase subunit 3 [Oleiharenicola lentus]|uniref:cytochrome c oxidase subunit 3 n=1 Tax=Oleiharenicola lentus TaxID=2508720 RepID=UPI003F676522